MLYNTKRTANIKAKTKAKCFKLQRKAFNTIVQNKNLRKRQTLSDVIKKIDIFQKL